MIDKRYSYVRSDEIPSVSADREEAGPDDEEHLNDQLAEGNHD